MGWPPCKSPMIEPIISPGDSMTPEISLFLEKIKKSVIKCDIILKAKVIIDS